MFPQNLIIFFSRIFTEVFLFWKTSTLLDPLRELNKNPETNVLLQKFRFSQQIGGFFDFAKALKFEKNNHGHCYSVDEVVALEEAVCS